jgi:threonine aldolase
MICLTKGLSCPLGSLVVGSEEFIARADRCRKRLGGGMRQAGVIAAAGVVALEQMIDRLAEDHANAQVLARGVNEIPGLHVGLESVETNMVYVNHRASGLHTTQVLNRLKQAGVLASARPPNHIRLVTHRHHDSCVIEEAIRRVRIAVESPK